MKLKCKQLILSFGILLSCFLASALGGVFYANVDPGSPPTDFTSDGNCQAAYFMNSTGSTAETDQSGNSATLTVSAGDTIPSDADVPSGYSGTSRLFASADEDYLYMLDGGSTDISGADQALSICFWAKFSTSPASNPVFVGKSYGSTDDRQYQTAFDVSGDGTELRLSPSPGTSSYAALGATGIVTLGSGWHHYAMVYNDTDMRVYIDGVLDSNSFNNPYTYSSGIYNGDEDFYVGTYHGTEAFFDGYMDELIIFDRAISASEVIEIRDNGIDGSKGAND